MALSDIAVRRSHRGSEGRSGIECLQRGFSPRDADRNPRRGFIPAFYRWLLAVLLLLPRLWFSFAPSAERSLRRALFARHSGANGTLKLVDCSSFHFIGLAFGAVARLYIHGFSRCSYLRVAFFHGWVLFTFDYDDSHSRYEGLRCYTITGFQSRVFTLGFSV